jgi:hypothetical protein
MNTNNDAASMQSPRGWFFVLDRMGALCPRIEHFSMRLKEAFSGFLAAYLSKQPKQADATKKVPYG